MNKFVGFLETVGRDFKKVSPWALPLVEEGLTVAFPALGSIFSVTANAIITAEKKQAALGKQGGTGEQKAADVIQIAGPLIAVALADAGKASDAAAVRKYVDSAVTILSLAPAPAGS